ncbi:MAG: carboxymuconolactone decarboxylase family protein [Candidatus Zixiibacteriota bacterium]|nr:MAG: carboxymuconolactone decarboxylase family protein [candidate division Zixibacteria bacterium]
MEKDKISAFRTEREKLNELVMRYAGTNTKRLFNIDWQVYHPGALPAATKELLGLVASLVLRCDECVLYHLIRCHEEGIGSAELDEAMAIGQTVGGSITVPHLRRAWRAWDEIKRKAPAKKRRENEQA